ncbi:MAG: M48 family peptidase, partial [Janthinobacterium lividum]
MTLPVRTQRPRSATRAATALLSWTLVCVTAGAGLPGAASATPLATGGPAPASPAPGSPAPGGPA